MRLRPLSHYIRYSKVFVKCIATKLEVWEIRYLGVPLLQKFPLSPFESQKN